jgi:outer membrane immunogenic protein
MKLLSGIWVLTLTSVVALATANAADVYGGYKDGPAYVVVNWSGFYAGINGGGAWDDWDRHGGMEDNGGFGGGQIESDFEGVGISNSRAGTITWSSGGVDTDIHHRAIDYVGTVRGRIGYSFGPVLPYFTGGFAYGDKTNEFNDLGAKHPGLFKDDGMKAGYVLGGGFEYKVSPAWSVKAEYQFIDLGHDNATDGTAAYIRTKDTELNTVRGGINYQFMPGYVPLK